jgi:hypothetical protein
MTLGINNLEENAKIKSELTTWLLNLINSSSTVSMHFFKFFVVYGIVKLGIIPASCAAIASLESDIWFIGAQIIGYFELNKI